MIHSCTTRYEDIQIFNEPENFYTGIIPSISFEQALHFLAKVFPCPVCKLRISAIIHIAWNQWENGDSKERSPFISWTQQRSLLLQHCIFAPTFLYEMSLFRSPLLAFTFRTCSFEASCINDIFNVCILQEYVFYL